MPTFFYISNVGPTDYKSAITSKHYATREEAETGLASSIANDEIELYEEEGDSYDDFKVYEFFETADLGGE